MMPCTLPSPLVMATRISHFHARTQRSVSLQSTPFITALPAPLTYSPLLCPSVPTELHYLGSARMLPFAS